MIVELISLFNWLLTQVCIYCSYHLIFSCAYSSCYCYSYCFFLDKCASYSNSKCIVGSSKSKSLFNRPSLAYDPTYNHIALTYTDFVENIPDYNGLQSFPNINTNNKLDCAFYFFNSDSKYSLLFLLFRIVFFYYILFLIRIILISLYSFLNFLILVLIFVFRFAFVFNIIWRRSKRYMFENSIL